jgi:hypothetical protein
METAREYPGPLPPGHPVRQKIKDGLVALSLANLFFISAWYPLLYGGDSGYFKKPVTLPALLAMAANLLWFASLSWLVIRAWRRSDTRWLRLAGDCLLLLLLLVPLDFCRRQVFHILLYQVVAFLKSPAVLLSAALVWSLVLWQHRRAARLAAIAVGVFSPLAVFTLIRIALLSLGLSHPAQSATEPSLPSPGPVSPGRPRVLWIIFDETDQRLAFEERPAGLRMPEFDRLRSQSLYATNAYPPGDSTLFSMPGLISGQGVAAVSVKSESDLAVTLADNGNVTPWSQLPSVFADARELGVNTALVGWYHPYRRVLFRGLNYCSWHPYPGWFPAQAPTFGAAMLSQIGCLASDLQHERLYANACRQMMTESLSLATNTTYGLLLLHLPPPHRPGIYLPDKDQFSLLSQPAVPGYFNNLVLADRWLGKLRRALEDSGLWSQTWLLLSADHSWRASSLYDHRRDLRVPFLLKTGGEPASMTYSSRFNTVLTRDLILAILRGQVGSRQDISAWLDAHRSEHMPVISGPSTAD